MKTETRQDIATGAWWICAHCRREIQEVQDPYSWTLDYGDNGDFGCDANPMSGEYGTFGHVPDVSIGAIERTHCRHCDRLILEVEGSWVDPAAAGDDGVWRDVCDSHDSFMADHEPHDA